MIENPTYSAIQDATDKWQAKQEDAITLCQDLLDYCKRLEHRLNIDSRILNKYQHKLRRLRQ